MTDAPYRTVCDEAAPELVPGQIYETPNPLRGRTWTDSSGLTWRRRGQDCLTPRQARRALQKPDTVVMHVNGGAPHPHAGINLAGLLAEMERVWSGDDDEGLHTFEVGEFRDDAHRGMVMIVEGC